MSMASFIVFLAGFLLVGLASVFKSRGTKSDYYIASRSVSPALTGLSAVATNNSGYMFIGVIGFTYLTGLAAIWLMLGWILGDFLASLFIHRQLRISTEHTREITFAGVLSRWQGGDLIYVRKFAAVITVLFLGAYAAAQLAAGGKALHVLFGWAHQSGAILVAVIVAGYCLAGGIRASIWTDAAQSLVMVCAMGLLFIVGVDGLGGIDATWQQLAQIPHYLNWFPDNLLMPGLGGVMLFVVGWMFAGFSVIGQPHIMIRFMALDNANHMRQARVYYYSFFYDILCLGDRCRHAVTAVSARATRHGSRARLANHCDAAVATGPGWSDPGGHFCRDHVDSRCLGACLLVSIDPRPGAQAAGKNLGDQEHDAGGDSAGITHCAGGNAECL